MSLLFNMLSRFVIASLPRSKQFLISLLRSPSTVILEPKKVNCVTASPFSPSICHEMMRPDALILLFWMISFKPVFHSPLSPSSRGSLIPLYFLPLGWYHLHIWGGIICISEDISPSNLDNSLWFISPTFRLMLIAYGEWCWIGDLRRRFSFGIRDQAWSLRAFVWQKFYYGEKGQKKLLT